jgi:hypothetical protein
MNPGIRGDKELLQENAVHIAHHDQKVIHYCPAGERTMCNFRRRFEDDVLHNAMKWENNSPYQNES